MANKTCSRCNEENPAGAVMCWACYMPFDGTKPIPFRLSEYEPEVRFPQTKWWRENARIIMIFSAAFGFISSGWWRGKTRFWVVGSSLSLLVGSLALLKREEALYLQENTDSRSAMQRIADTIMSYSIRDGATQIHMMLKDEFIQVKYRIKDEWHEQMRLPDYIWKPLQNELAIRAGTGVVALDAKDELDDRRMQGQFSLRILIEPPLEEILLTNLSSL